MALLPVNEDLVATAIYATYERVNRSPKRRAHLGASLIGGHCQRATWYTFRWASPSRYTGRALRLFDTGKREEPRVVADLRNAGMVVHDVDVSTHRQFSFSDHGGHFCGSLDGAILRVPGAEKTWHVLEIKTHNSKSFGELKLGGVQKSKPQHLLQMQTYMGWSGMTRALYVAVCKDNDEIFTERVAFAPRLFEEARATALMIIEAKEPLKRTESDLCVFCDHRDVCLCGAFPEIHCRTCLHLHPDLVEGGDGRWFCRRKDEHLTAAQQELGCDNHLFIPALVTTGIAVEHGDNFVIYQAHDGTYFANGGAEGFPAISWPSYRSHELGRRSAP